MTHLRSVAAAAALVTATLAPPAAAVEPTGDEAREPLAVLHFANLNGIRSWKVLADGSLLVEGRNRRYFVATFFERCLELPHAAAVGFVTDVTGDLTKFDSILVRGERCHFRTLEEVSAEAAKALR
jgi:hypothetical protein